MSEKNVLDSEEGADELEMEDVTELGDDADNQNKDSVMAELSDVVFRVEGRDIKAVKSVLCLASPVFRTMFGPNFKERDRREVELPGKELESFGAFLECFSPHILRPITVDNVYSVLPLVDEYQVESLRGTCCEVLEGQLTESLIPREIYRHLQLAEKFNLPGRLVEKCRYLASELTVDKMNECEQEFKVSPESRERIKELALMRYDLQKADDHLVLPRMHTSTPTTAQQALKNELIVLYKNTILGSNHGTPSRTLNLYLPTTSTNQSALRAIRLCCKYLPQEKTMLSDCVRYIRRHKGTFTEEENRVYELLPEKIKHDIRGRYVKTIE